MQYVNASMLVNRLRSMESSGLIDAFEDVLFEIENAVGVDIVFCKDCAFFSKSGESVGRITLYHCAKRGTGTTKEGFCNYGERREF